MQFLYNSMYLVFFVEHTHTHISVIQPVSPSPVSQAVQVAVDAMVKQDPSTSAGGPPFVI